MKKPIMLATVLAAAMATGCYTENPMPGPEDSLYTRDFDEPALNENTDYESLVGSLAVRDGTLDGAIGEVDGLRRDSETDVSGWGEPYYASIYTVGWGRNGAAMTILEVEGGLNNAELQPGAHFEFDIYDNEPGSDLHAYVVGCSGPQENEWEFDQVADTTTIDVSEDPNDPSILVLDYVGEFTDWNTGERSQVQGTVEVEREPAG